MGSITSSSKNGTPTGGNTSCRDTNLGEEGHRSSDEAAVAKVVLEDLNAVEMKISSEEEDCFTGSDEEEEPQSEEEDEEEEEDSEREAILRDCRALKELAVAYAHPQLGVMTNGLQARCFFSRVTAPEEDEDEDERAAVLADCAALKQLAVDYAHPEVPVTTNGSTARCFFDRASAPQADAERDEILSDCAALKQLAVAYAHVEIPVTTNGDSGRCYFEEEAEEEEVDEETRLQILADCAALKKLAVDYAHPEIPVQNGLQSRCFFDRASAPQADGDREEILNECAALKQLAVDYAHPELPVPNGVPSSNFFNRVNAPEEEDEDEEDERDEILADCAALKQLAVDYAHPEVPITSNGSTARCFFDRASAPQADAERDEILADCAALKQLAVDYAHVEIPVTTNGNCGRCYFERASKEVAYLEEIKGVIDDDLSEAEMRAEILKDAKALKQLAIDYGHPEIAVSSTASNVSRCFFTRSGAEVDYVSAFVAPMQVPDKRTRAMSDQFQIDLDIEPTIVVDENVIFDVSNVDDGMMDLDDDDVDCEEEDGKLSKSPSSILLLELGKEQEAN